MGEGDHTWVETYAVDREDLRKIEEAEKNFRKQLQEEENISLEIVSTDVDDSSKTLNDFDLEEDATEPRSRIMPKARPLTKESIISAMDKTKSVRAAARYLNCSYQHIKKWMKLYVDSSGVSLFDAHKNQSGKGIPKFLSVSNLNKKNPRFRYHRR